MTTLKAKLAAQESATEESKDREESLAAQLQAFAEKEAALKGEVMMLHQQASERDRAKEAELEEPSPAEDATHQAALQALAGHFTDERSVAERVAEFIRENPGTEASGASQDGRDGDWLGV